MKLLSKLQESHTLIQQFKQLPPIPTISYVVEKTPAWIGEKLLPLFEASGIVWMPLDGKYYLTDQDNFLNIVAWDWTDSYTYVRDRWDCDKFAVRFKSQVDRHFGLNQVGLVFDYKSAHAYNLAIFPDGNIMLIEPQSDAIFFWVDRAVKFYSLEGAVVVL